MNLEKKKKKLCSCLKYIKFSFQNFGYAIENKTDVDRLLLVSKLKKVQFLQNLSENLFPP